MDLMAEDLETLAHENQDLQAQLDAVAAPHAAPIEEEPEEDDVDYEPPALTDADRPGPSGTTVDTPAKRKDCFLEGLSAELQDRLNLNMGGSFAEFVNNAIVTEDGYRRVMAERKRSASAMGPSIGPPQ
ncbi:hypothetical protein PR202_ga17254 [Eleusine coracana subsp. coracana]|uniref:Uncharacterized protein n=1 Tax=Eleusine coracana subsp. coracana TaxID=191504 RepID=A0AAV5CQ98_ELECO|nr:hypothetical protein PR202_ga17254 [Eleusine coracana subsp. coracana]